MMNEPQALVALSRDRKERKEFARGWLLLSPTFTPYLTKKGRQEREKLLRELADANSKNPLIPGGR